MAQAQLAPIIEQYYTKSLQGRKIFKDQCVRCFIQPTHQHGLYVCMKCFNGFCHHHMAQHTNIHKHPLYLNIKMIPIVKEQNLQITKLAIGVQGGALGQTEYQTKYTLWCGFTNKPHIEGQKALQAQIKSLINTDSPFKKQSLASWEVEIVQCQHTLTLHQQVVNKKLEHCSSCQLSTNLWLCLTCGNAGCGRKNWDGSGGNNHAINHFEQTGHPVVVKLGTITAQGSASLYCYACNNEVRDQFLAEHLICLGIQIKNQTKTQKTVEQINLQINLNFSLSKLIEDKEHQYRVYGPGFTGMNNIGNSCYLNSVVQTLNCLPQFQHQYYKKGIQHIENCKKIPSECFYCQISKISWGLNSGRYSQKKEKTYTINSIQTTQQYQEGIKPFDFKLLIGKDNAEFLSNRQQDALQYLQWVFDKLDKEEAFIGESTTKHFNFQSVNRLVCTNCNGYKLINTKTNQWKYPVPLPTQNDLELYYSKLQGHDPQTKKAKLIEDPQYNVKFQTCLNLLIQGDSVAVKCQNCKSQTIFSSRNYIATTPKYLLAIPNRFIVEKWVPKKLNALIQVQEDFNIEKLLIHHAPSAGIKLNAPGKAEKFTKQNVQMLVMMGFTENAAKRALIQTKNDLQAASNWLMQNIQNYEINLPLKQQNKPQSFTINQEAVSNMAQFGFSQQQIKIALIKNNNSQEAATQWLFTVDGDVSNYIGQLQKLKGSKQNSAAEYQKPVYTNYKLKAVIIHLGKSVHSGHYVAYIKTEKGWTLFNDQKVTVTQNPVLGKGYIYLYEGIS